jgi:hypothetical protein
MSIRRQGIDAIAVLILILIGILGRIGGEDCG